MQQLTFEMHEAGWDAAAVAGFASIAIWLRFGRERFYNTLPPKEQERKLAEVYREAKRLTTAKQ